MGIDASSTSTGISIFNDKKLIFHTTIKPEGKEWHERLFNQGPQLINIINNFNPDIVYMEDVPLKATGGLKTLVILGGVQGYFSGIMASYNIQINFISPAKWRSKIGIYDGTKEGMKRENLKQKAIMMANKLFDLNLCWMGPNSKKTQDDEAEAILIAYSQIY